MRNSVHVSFSIGADRTARSWRVGINGGDSSRQTGRGTTRLVRRTLVVETLSG
jgi:hypothetical protein